MASLLTLVEVEEDGEIDLSEAENDPAERLIRYHLGPDFLKLKTVGLKLNFANGPGPVKDMMMIERHYFRGRCIRSYDFKFDFLIPGS